MPYPSPQVYSHPSLGLYDSLSYCLANLFHDEQMLVAPSMSSANLRDYGDLLHCLHEASGGEFRFAPLVILPLGYPGGTVPPDLFDDPNNNYPQQPAVLAFLVAVADRYPIQSEGRGEQFLRHLLLLAKSYSQGGYLLDPSTGEVRELDSLTAGLRTHSVYSVIQIQRTTQGPDTCFALGGLRPLLGDAAVEAERVAYSFLDPQLDPYFEGPRAPEDEPAPVPPAGT